MFKSKILVCFAVLTLASSAFAGDLLLRGEVKVPDGTEIGFSVPVQVLEAIKTSGISALMEDKDQFCGLVDSLIGDIDSMKGKNLLEINMGKHGARISVDEANDDNPEEANFIKVDVKPAGENQPEVHFSLPKGIFFLGAFIGNQFMEQNGKELLDMLKQQIRMNCMPPQAMEGKCPAPCCAKPSEGEKTPSCEKMENEEGEEQEDVHEEEVNPDEIQKMIEKEFNPEKIKKMILESILKELK